jgi:hypothetical protein
VLAQTCNPPARTSCRRCPCHVVPWKIRAHAPTEIMMVESRHEVFVYFNSPQPTEHVVVLELSCARRRELGPRGTWRSRSCRGPWWWEPRGTRRSWSYPVLGDGSWGHRACGNPEAAAGPGGGSWSHEARGGEEALCQEMGAVGHAGMCAHLVFGLLLKACMQGYPIFRVPTLAPGPTLGEAAIPQVGPASFPVQPF